MGISGGVYALGSTGSLNHDFGGLAYSIPLPVLVLVLVVLVIAAFGLLSRFGSIVKGKGSATDYLGMLILMGLFLLVALLVGSGMLGGMRLF